MTRIQYRNLAGNMVSSGESIWLQSGTSIDGVPCDEYLMDDNTTVWLKEFEDVEVEMDDTCLNSYVDKEYASLYNA
jgi:hypothetical protein